MTLNYSHRTFFPVNPSEENLLSSVRDRYLIEGMSEKNGDAYGNSQFFDWEYGNSFDWGKDGADGSFQSVTNDIIDLLPSDPFGMNLSATITAAFAGFVGGDFEHDRVNIMWNSTLTFQTDPGNMEMYKKSNSSGRFDDNMGEAGSGYWQEGYAQNAEKVQSFNNEDIHMASQQYKESGNGIGRCGAVDEEYWPDGRALNAEKVLGFNNEDMHLASLQFKESGKGTGSCRAVDEGYRQDGCALNAEKGLSFNNEDMHVASQQLNESGEGTSSCCSVEEGAPNDTVLFALGHLGMRDLLSSEGEGTSSCCSVDEGAPNDAVLFSLGHLGMRDLLSAEGVCRSLRSSIQNDVLLWKNIIIDEPLSVKITDDTLLRLTNRAQGNLQCLSLVKCLRITDNGLKRVLDSNPRLTKLNVAECNGLSVDGIISNLRAFKSSGVSRINQLRVGARRGVTREHYEELKSLVITDKCMQTEPNKPHYFPYGHSSPCDDDRAIDIEICPKCENSRLVFDCTAESCQVKHPGTQTCRACIICIVRCAGCGRCVDNSQYEEVFTLDNLCFDCLERQGSCQERQEKGE